MSGRGGAAGADADEDERFESIRARFMARERTNQSFRDLMDIYHVRMVRSMNWESVKDYMMTDKVNGLDYGDASERMDKAQNDLVSRRQLIKFVRSRSLETHCLFVEALAQPDANPELALEIAKDADRILVMDPPLLQKIQAIINQPTCIPVDQPDAPVMQQVQTSDSSAATGATPTSSAKTRHAFATAAPATPTGHIIRPVMEVNPPFGGSADQPQVTTVDEQETPQGLASHHRLRGPGYSPVGMFSKPDPGYSPAIAFSEPDPLMMSASGPYARKIDSLSPLQPAPCSDADPLGERLSNAIDETLTAAVNRGANVQAVEPMPPMANGNIPATPCTPGGPVQVSTEEPVIVSVVAGDSTLREGGGSGDGEPSPDPDPQPTTGTVSSSSSDVSSNGNQRSSGRPRRPRRWYDSRVYPALGICALGIIGVTVASRERTTPIVLLAALGVTCVMFPW